MEPVKSFGNKIWLANHDRKPVVAKRAVSTTTRWTFFTTYSSCVTDYKILCRRTRMLQCLYYRDVKLQRFVPLRHDEAPSLTSKLMKQFLKSETLGSAIGQNLTLIPKSAYHDAFWKWNQRLKLCILNRSEYFEACTKCLQWSFHYLSQMFVK